MPKVLVYGEQDLNLVDGSSVWQASIIEVLSGIEGVSVDVLTRTPLRRDLLIGSLLSRPGVRFLDPYAARFPLRGLGRPSGARLDHEAAAFRIASLDAISSYDVVLIRSIGTAKDLLERAPGVLARSWLYVTRGALLGGDVAGARRLVQSCRRVLCQTPEVEEAVRGMVGPQERFGLLPPMVRMPEQARRQPRAGEPLRLVYSGKFSKGYFLEEMLDALAAARDAGIGLEFHIYGDKFHVPSDDPGFKSRLIARINDTDWVQWHGAVAREDVYDALRDCDVGISWRSGEFDDSPELSTKVLEYASLELPGLMNPNRVQRRVFGDDYAGFVKTADDVVRVLGELHSDYGRLAELGAACRLIAEDYSFEAAQARVGAYLAEDTSSGRDSVRARVQVVVEGHDLKFMREIYDYFVEHKNAALRVDPWLGHTDPDSSEREALLQSADVVWCEWLLGNAVHYARHKRPGQLLIVRLHHQEMGLAFRHQIRWEAVDALLITCYQHYDRLRAELPNVRDRIHLVPQLLTCDRFDRPKQPGAQFNLGLLGMAPFRKRPDLAVDLLEGLRRQDSRYSLSIKSRHPWEYGWLWERAEEQSAYQEFYERVRGVGGVHFEPPGSDVPDWLQRVGYIVSTSDHEGSHQAVAEGMASGAMPILRDWDGADRLYPDRFVFHDTEQAVERVLANQHRFAEESEECRAYARGRFDAPNVWELLDGLLAGSMG